VDEGAGSAVGVPAGPAPGAGERRAWERRLPDLLTPRRSAPEGLPWDRSKVRRPVWSGPLGLPLWWGWGQRDDDGSEPDDSEPLGEGDGPPAAGPSVLPGWLSELLSTVVRQPLESLAIVLLAVGVVVYAFPLWLLAAVAVIASRLWDTRDKVIALVVPAAIALLGGIMLAGITTSTKTLAGYLDAVGSDGWDLIRAGAMFGAVYLAWRVRQGRRPYREPPWSRTRRS